jgi:hypothetical protein
MIGVAVSDELAENRVRNLHSFCPKEDFHAEMPLSIQRRRKMPQCCAITTGRAEAFDASDQLPSIDQFNSTEIRTAPA